LKKIQKTETKTSGTDSKDKSYTILLYIDLHVIGMIHANFFCIWSTTSSEDFLKISPFGPFLGMGPFVTLGISFEQN